MTDFGRIGEEVKKAGRARSPLSGRSLLYSIVIPTFIETWTRLLPFHRHGQLYLYLHLNFLPFHDEIKGANQDAFFFERGDRPLKNENVFVLLSFSRTLTKIYLSMKYIFRGLERSMMQKTALRSDAQSDQISLRSCSMHLALSAAV